MARKGRGGGGGGGRGAGRGSRRSSTGIEKYGQDDADEFLALDEDVGAGEYSQDEEEDEDVMALKPYKEDEEEDEGAKKKKKKGKKGKAAMSDDEDEEEDIAPASKDWRRGDFYGGDDVGDSDEDSGEEFDFKEARKLEQLRAARLRAAGDPLASLLLPDPSAVETSKAAKAEEKPSSAAVALDADAQFESLFAAEAEKTSVQRDISQLSSSKRRSLLKKESPELLPLLNDFKSKLESLQSLLPLVSPAALARLPSSGAGYLQTKVSLLLNHLSNLSFYLLLKAQGSDVRAHPVISQLVWLKDLDGQMEPLDKRLGAKLKKAAKVAETIVQERQSPEGNTGDAEPQSQSEEDDDPASPELSAQKKQPKTLAERLARLKGAGEGGKSRAAAEKEPARLPAAASMSKSTASLLKLPKRKSRGDTGGGGDAPADLEDLDPVLGAWLPSASMSSHISEVQQHLKERKAKAAPQASDANPEPRARVHRERVQEELDPRSVEAEAEASEAEAEAEAEEDANDLVSQAKAKAKARREERTKAQSAKEKAKLAKQYHPETNVEGRRATSRQILENRGLQRQRKKKAGNARVSNREKYDKMVKRRKGAVQEMREAAGDGATYEGEATGIRSHLKKSLKIG